MNKLYGTAALLIVVVSAGCSNGSSSPVAASAVASTTAASGAPAPTEESYVSDSCGYPINVALQGKVKELPLPGDRLKILFPAYTTTVTNPSTGKTISFSATGSFHITFLPNGHTKIVYAGRNGYDDPFAGQFLFLIGTFSEEFDENFEVVAPLDGNGQIIDVCSKLAN